jgi:hypothetical protein
MKFPAYGRALWDRRMSGETPRVVALLVGNRWRRPDWIPGEIPLLAVKPAAWSRVDKLTTHFAATSEAVKGDARRAVARALRSGALQPQACEMCGHHRVEAHHDSYAEDDWLTVRWLCKQHHAAEHTIIRSQRDRYDWKLVVSMTVLAVDTMTRSERRQSDGWDEWLWLLADVQTYARDVLLFTPTIEFADQPQHWAPERTLETYAWINRRFDPAAGKWEWPPWWPHGEQIFHREAA